MPYKDKEKQKRFLHRYYVSNRNAFRKRRRKDVDKKRQFVFDMKNVPCADCGKNYPPYVMDFDHIDPTTKLATVASLVNKSWERLKAEIAKCEVVCANCHRIRTYNKELRYRNNGSKET